MFGYVSTSNSISERSESPPSLPAGSTHFEFLTVWHLVLLASLALSAHLALRAAELRAQLAFEAAALNNSRGARHELVIFNRVPKVGSQTIKSLLHALQYRNNFTHVVDREDIKATRGELTIISHAEQRNYVNMFLANITPPATYSKHISYIDFYAHGKDWQVGVVIRFFLVKTWPNYGQETG